MNFLKVLVLASFMVCLLFTAITIVLCCIGIVLPDTLIQSFFTVFGGELGAAALIKIAKYITNDTTIADRLRRKKENKVPLRPFLKLIEKTERNYAENKLKEVVYENGTKFIRSYKGEKYEVEVLKEGFLFRGEIYKSLSAIARKITGKNWNGKIFFGGNNGIK